MEPLQANKQLNIK